MQKLVSKQVNISSSSEVCFLYFLHFLTVFPQICSHSLLNTSHSKALHSVQLAEHRMTQGIHAGKKKKKSRRVEATEVQALKQLISLEH